MNDEKRKSLDAELAAHNAAVTAALATRKAWMDAHMPDYARYQIGEGLFNLDTGNRLGTVSKLYRYWSERDPRYDTSMSIEYGFCTGNNCFDNTSRHAGALRFGNAADLKREMEMKALMADPIRWERAWERAFPKP